MSFGTSFDENSDIIDTREIIERIEEIEAELDDIPADGTNADSDERAELVDERAELRDFADELRSYAVDFDYGATVIRDSYFEDYARELAESIGAISEGAEWPLRHIDWAAAAEELQQDYSAVEWRGVTFWVRG